jgi:RimJ/RimL family protein N-acetyltransferase
VKPIDAVVLKGSLVRLEPLDAVHVPGLIAAADEDRSAYAWTVVPSAEETAAYVAAQLASDGMTPFAQVRLSDEAPVGCTAFWNPRAWPGREDLYAVEIGWTWLAASAQRTGINAEAKLLLLQHAFDELGLLRVDWKTDARNQRSRQAIAGLGARFEGVLRNWSPSRVPGEEGRLRDSAIFSVTEAEWPSVKSALSARIANGGTTSPVADKQDRLAGQPVRRLVARCPAGAVSRTHTDGASALDRGCRQVGKVGCGIRPVQGAAVFRVLNDDHRAPLASEDRPLDSWFIRVRTSPPRHVLLGGDM